MSVWSEPKLLVFSRTGSFNFFDLRPENNSADGEKDSSCLPYYLPITNHHRIKRFLVTSYYRRFECGTSVVVLFVLCFAVKSNQIKFINVDFFVLFAPFICVFTYLVMRMPGAYVCINTYVSGVSLILIRPDMTE